MENKTKHFLVLDSFRGIAAIFIIAFHLKYVGSITETSFIKNAYLFVDMFFVLSGFVLTHSNAFKKDLNFKSFFIARFFRIYPLHIFMFSVVLLIEVLKMVGYKYGIHFNNIPFTGDNNPIYIIPHILLLQSWLNIPELGFNGPAWSISVEFYLYIIFFITLIIKSKIKYLLWAILSIIAICLMLSNKEILFNNGVYRGIFGFFIGSLTYLLYKSVYMKIKSLHSVYFTIMELTILMLLYILFISDLAYKPAYIVILFAFQMFIFSFEKGMISSLLLFKPFQLIGRLSYSIYLIHYTVIFVTIALAILLGKFGIHITETINGVRYIDYGNIYVNNTVVVLIILCVVYLSTLTYKYIEIKGQNIGKKLQRRNKV